jgi:uncharacterized membrane protein
MKTFTVTFSLTAGEEKALLQRFASIEKMISDYVTVQAEQAMKTLVQLYANGEKTATLTKEDKLAIDAKDSRIIKDVNTLSKDVMEIIVNKIDIVTYEKEVIVEESTIKEG